MPEGPEVETVVRTLEKQIKGNKILKTEIFYPNIVETIDFEEKMLNQRFETFNRKGKFLVLGLTKGYLIVHLRMEGKFYIDTDPFIDKHIHLMFHLDDGRYLKYNDTRKFGRLAWVKNFKDYPGIMRLGPDVLDGSFDLAYFKERVNHRIIPIKSLLLDQSFVAGIGNIYANEILYLSRIHPATPSNTISTRKINEIIRNSKQVINEAIEMGGTTIRSYTSSLNVHGRFDQQLKAHQQEICERCQRPIRKIMVNQRGTYYCPHCQRKRK